MIYREVAERIGQQEYPDIDAEHVIIAGFNALSTSERKLFSHLRDSGRALFYWDYDRRYREGNIAEAGRFIRRNLEEFPPDRELPEEFDNLMKPKTFRSSICHRMFCRPKNCMRSWPKGKSAGA